MADMHPLDHEARALWHLELLGCFEPSDAVAPWEPASELEWMWEECEWDERDEGDYLGEAVTCWGCGGEGIVVFCCDDICQGQGYCMHGDGDSICRDCGGEGRL